MRSSLIAVAVRIGDRRLAVLGANAVVGMLSGGSPESTTDPCACANAGTSVDPLSRADLLRLIEAIRALARGRTNSNEYLTKVAKRVFDDAYGGKLEAFRFEGEGGPKFNDLARDLRKTIKRSTLHRALWAYEVRETTPIYRVKETSPEPAQPPASGPRAVPALERLPPDQLEHLKVLHYYAVRSLAAAQRSELLSLSVHYRWSTRRLEAEVAALGTERRGPPPMANILKLLHRVDELHPSAIDVSPLTRLPDTGAEVYEAILSDMEELVLRAQVALAERRAATGGE